MSLLQPAGDWFTTPRRTVPGKTWRFVRTLLPLSSLVHLAQMPPLGGTQKSLSTTLRKKISLTLLGRMSATLLR